MRKSLYDISLKITEPEYRARPELSYSTLAKYEREGFNKLGSLFDRIETSSLTFGSAVDCVITGGKNGWKDFSDNFVVMESTCSDSIQAICKYIYNEHKDSYRELASVPSDRILDVVNIFKYQPRWKDTTRVTKILEEGAGFYNALFNAENKTIIDEGVYNDVVRAVNALKTSPATSWYFYDDDPNPDIERLYQLKFAADIRGVGYRCMADLIICDYKNKNIILTDLKTSSHLENEFYKSFIDWSYNQQARLYSLVIKENCMNDDYFKDFTFSNYNFIVVNKNSLKPLVWEYKDTHKRGTLTYGKNNGVIMRDPLEIGEELNDYLLMQPEFPFGIHQEQPNDIIEWINKTYN